ncbi:NACHT, LRR and PYD domains-containing protein 1 homolog [Ptychodera flava]|uniref:NACHT, LRR and PYD domains-containing protein 1 homolog n=1 Tax=Ptychodera flava TaxID=63121 RepID=UPI003969DD47
MATGEERSCTDESSEKRPKLDPFTTTLYEIAQDVTTEKLEELKYLCSSLIPKRDRETMKEPHHLFRYLTESGKISDTDTSLLQDLLHKTGLQVLSKKLKSFHANQPSSGQSFQANDTTSKGNLKEQEKSLVEILKREYRGRFARLQPLLWNDDPKLKLKEVYTRLTVKSAERGPTKAGQDLKDINDMFMADEEGQCALRILMEGPPAMGKSTGCRKIAYDWACGKQKQYKFVFILEMRHVSTGSKVIDEIFTQLLPKDFSITKEELANIISQQEKSTFFLFDGLDEISKDKIEGSEIADHIAKKLRAYCTIVITTRPHLRDRYLSDCDLHLTVKGFTEMSTNEYIEKYFKDDKDTGMTLKQQIKFQRKDITAKNITDLLRNPLHVSFLCILWEDHERNKRKNPFPKNHTELYSEILECIFKRYCAKKDIELNDGKIPKFVIDLRDKLAIDSYKLYSADKTDFYKADISCEQYLDLGFLVRDPGDSRTKAIEFYYFNHKTWLEFFTAFYISSRLEVGDTTGLDSLFSDPQKSTSVLKFLAGISESKASGLLFDRFNQEIQTLKNECNPSRSHPYESVELCSLLGLCFECLHESKLGLECASHVEMSIQGILLYAGVKASIFQCNSLCDSPNHEVSRFIRVNRTHCHIAFILHFMKLQPGQIEVLRMYHPTIQEMSMLSNTLSDTESNVMLKTLEIHIDSKNIVQHVDKLSILIRNGKEHSTLQILNIHLDSESYYDDDDDDAKTLKISLVKLFAEIADNENIQNFALTLEHMTFNKCSSLPIFEKFIDKGPRTVKFTMAGSKCQLFSLCNFMKNCRKTESIKLEFGDIDHRSDVFNLELNMCLQNMSTSIKALSLWIERLQRDSALFDTLSTNTTLSEISIGEFTNQSSYKACVTYKT